VTIRKQFARKNLNEIFSSALKGLSNMAAITSLEESDEDIEMTILEMEKKIEELKSKLKQLKVEKTTIQTTTVETEVKIAPTKIDNETNSKLDNFLVILL